MAMPKGWDDYNKRVPTSSSPPPDPNEYYYKHHYTRRTPHYNYPKKDPTSIKGVVLIMSLIVGFALMMVAIFTLNWVVIILGLVVFGIGIGLWGYAAGSYSHGHHGSSGYSDSFFINRWGSANAKRNMWRGHRNSKRSR